MPTNQPAASALTKWLDKLLRADHGVCLNTDYIEKAITAIMRDSDMGLAVKIEQILDNAYSDYSDSEKVAEIRKCVSEFLE